MEHVRRSGVKAHADWQKSVKAALPKDFRKHAKAFEKIDIDDPKRRAKGAFTTFAPTALPPPAKGKKKQDFPPLWRTDKRVKKNIGDMSRGFCVYCQSHVVSNQAGHVEHYRPKALFPSLAYEWGNYFLSCEKCNLAKGNKWPAKHEGSYVRPDQRNPGKRFVFLPNGSMKARAGDKEAEVTCRDLRLDRPELRRFRRAQIKIALRVLKDALKRNPKMTKAQVRRYLVKPLELFSVAINQSAWVIWEKAKT